MDLRLKNKICSTSTDNAWGQKDAKLIGPLHPHQDVKIYLNYAIGQLCDFLFTSHALPSPSTIIVSFKFNIFFFGYCDEHKKISKIQILK